MRGICAGTEPKCEHNDCLTGQQVRRDLRVENCGWCSLCLARLLSGNEASIPSTLPKPNSEYPTSLSRIIDLYRKHVGINIEAF